MSVLPEKIRSTGTAGTGRTVEGLVSGKLLRAARLSIRAEAGQTQERVAAAAGVDLNTYRGWESGRRPLFNASARTVLQLRRLLLGLGARPELVALLDTALDVDLFLADVIGRNDVSLLSSWVTTRAWNDLLAWAVTGRTPPFLPVGTAAPLLPAAEHSRFFAAVREAAEPRLKSQDDGWLQRRQAFFISAWDRGSAAAPPPFGTLSGGAWSPSWVAGRSLAVAVAAAGDPEPLRYFIGRALDGDQRAEAANLNYWAYWIGECEPTATTDRFMDADLGSWRGDALLGHLAHSLDVPPPYIDLSVHTIRSLLARRPQLLMQASGVASALATSSARLLDDGGQTPETRRSLDQIHFLASTIDPARRPS